MNKLVPLIGIQAVLALLVLLNAAVPQAPLSPTSYFNPPFAYAWLNTIFLLPAGLVVAYISSKAFLRDGHLSIQIMGCGILALCLATLSTWVGTSDQDIAFYYIVLNLFGIFFGAVFQATGALLTQRDVVVAPGQRRSWLVAAYGALALVAALVSLGAAERWIPPFFASSQPTSLSVDVLICAAALFALACAVLGRNYLATRSDILYWYVVGMLLVVTSIVTYVFIRHPGDPISWLYRTITILYGGAFFTAVLSSRPETEPPRGD